MDYENDFFCIGKTCFNRPRTQIKNQIFIEKPFELESYAIQKGSKVITRKFALIPDTYYKRQEYKKITDRMVKFRDLENIYIHILIRSLQNGKLTPQNFERTSKPFIHRNIYSNLHLTNVRANQFKEIELKERIRRCALIYPFHAVRNWLIRNYNLSRVIDQLESIFRSNPSLISNFILGKGTPKNILQSIFTLLDQDLFGNRQSLSYFLIDNMMGQIRNIFLNNSTLESTLRARLNQFSQSNLSIQKFLKKCILDFSYKKKSKFIKLKIPDLPKYFLNKYFINLKKKDTRKIKKTMNAQDFKIYKQNRDAQIDIAKNYVENNIKRIAKREVWSYLLDAFHCVFQDYSENPNIILTRHIFKPFYIKSPLTNPDLQGFMKFFIGVLQNKIREHFKELFITKEIMTALLNDLGAIRHNINTLTKIPQIKELSIPIKGLEQVYTPDYSSLKAKLSFIQREFINLKIQDRNGRIATLTREGAIPKVPVISFKQRKLILNLPFEVKRKVVSKQSQAPIVKKRNVEIGVDLGLKHFAVLSVMDNTSQIAPKEIDRYFIGSKQLFDMKFDSTIGKFVKRRNHRARNNSNIKLQIIYLRENIRIIQRKKNEYEERCIARGENFKKKLKFHKLSEMLSILWERSLNINIEIVRLLNHHIIAIANYHRASKIKMENLKFSKHSKKRERGKYLAFWQTHWLFGQIQEAVKLQGYLHNIKFERVYAAHTSQRCPECGLIEYKDSNGALVYLRKGLIQSEQRQRKLSRTKSRDGKRFTCQNATQHSNQTIFRLDADLSAARNVALA